jgi:hypothetical protein
MGKGMLSEFKELLEYVKSHEPKQNAEEGQAISENVSIELGRMLGRFTLSIHDLFEKELAKRPKQKQPAKLLLFNGGKRDKPA